MPGMDGTQTLSNIRAQEGGSNKETPVICLTADAIAGAKERYMESGFTDYLSKPVEGAKLEMDMDGLHELYEAIAEFAEAFDTDGINALMKQAHEYKLPDTESERFA